MTRQRHHHPEAVAHFAATLLAGKSDAEAHHVKAAVATARMILDEAHGCEEPEAAIEAPASAGEADPEPAADPAAKSGEGDKQDAGKKQD